ncbi:MAG: TlpA family protein disulfide reductase [Granulosicoccus sp.]
MNFRVLIIPGIVGLIAGAYFFNHGQSSVEPGLQAAEVPGTGVADIADDEGSGLETEESGPVQQLSSVDRVVPTFNLASLDNTPWTLDSLKGKPWVINFWATWCPPCIEEIPSMNAAFEALEPQGIGMLAINAGEGTEAVEEFLKKISIDFPNILGDANTLPNWSVKALPTTIVVDTEGNVVYEALGPREWDDERLLQKVVDLL